MGELAEGVYESLHTAGLSRELAGVELTPRFEVVDPADAPDVLARHVADAVRPTCRACARSRRGWRW